MGRERGESVKQMETVQKTAALKVLCRMLKYDDKERTGNAPT